MTDADDQLSRLFREGTAPDRDGAFAALVMTDVLRMQRRANALLIGRLLATLVVLALVAAALAWVGPDVPNLAMLNGLGEVMSVPAPLFGLAMLLLAVWQARALLRRLRPRAAA